MMLQIVYVLTNPAMPGFVKIEKTKLDDVKGRIDQLYTTGVPFPFEVAFAGKVTNADEVEKALHIAFAPQRVNPKREFFKIDPGQAIAILKLLHIEDASEQVSALPSSIPADEVEAANRYKARRPNLNFREMGIPENSILQFVDGPQTVVVSGERTVTLEGEEMSLTGATRKILDLPYSVQPSPWWTYNGRLLRDMY